MSKMPKRKLAAGFIGLILAMARLTAESMLRSVVDVVAGVLAAGSMILLAIAIVGFITAYEYQTEENKKETERLKTELKNKIAEYEKRCETCSFSHQSMLVGLSASHYNELQEQRDFYEDYITAVLYTFNEVLMRLAKSEATMMPLIEALLESPMYKIEKSEELEKWKNFLTALANGLSNSD